MAQSIELQSPQNPDHLDALADMFGKTFSGYWDRVEDSRPNYFGNRNYDWQASKIGLSDGQLVSHFGVWEYQMRIGASLVRMAGIGAVATLKTMRGQGLMMKTATACVDSLRENGYDISLLFGIPNFYHRFGYVVTYPEASFIVQLRDIPESVTDVPYEEYTGDAADLAQFYNKDNATVTGTYVRPTYLHVRNPKLRRCFTFDGGYVWVQHDGDILNVNDCAGPPESVVAVARSIAATDVKPRIRFKFIPRRSPVGEYVQTLTNTYEAHHERTGGPMFKIINIGSLFEKITDELSRRLAESPMRAYSGTLVLADAGEAVRLTVTDGAVTAVEPVKAATDSAAAPADPASDAASPDPGRAADALRAASGADGAVAGGISLVRLVIGDGDPKRVCSQGSIGLSGDAADLVPILFPDQEPSTIQWDRF
jgi:hypothetical protein